jgi:hypothetical protein
MAIAAGTFAIAMLASSALAQHDTANTGAVTVRKDTLQAIPADALKREYLKCERAAAQGIQDFSTALSCSMLYEELRQRVFGGNFNALLGWWRANNGVDTATR